MRKMDKNYSVSISIISILLIVRSEVGIHYDKWMISKKYIGIFLKECLCDMEMRDRRQSTYFNHYGVSLVEYNMTKT